jgi:hypothetical protein
VIPEDVRSFCTLCPAEEIGLEAIVGHLETVHGMTAQRWPDGGLVVDASDTPELMEER